MLQATNIFILTILCTLYTNANLSRYARIAKYPFVGNVYNYKNRYAHCTQIKNVTQNMTLYKAPMRNINDNNALRANSNPAVVLEWPPDLILKH